MFRWSASLNEPVHTKVTLQNNRPYNMFSECSKRLVFSWLCERSGNVTQMFQLKTFQERSIKPFENIFNMH